jgi:DNA/RNA endonuclease YhcR with UshA esterase domain
MKVTQGSLVITMLLAACLAGSAFAQVGSNARRLYDPNTEITVKGTVEKVTEIGEQGRTGTHLTLRTNEQTYDVHVGPSAYVAASGFTFLAGDQVEVTGSKIKVGGSDAIVAREIRKDGKVLTLRDRQGIPKWSRGPRRTY